MLRKLSRRLVPRLVLARERLRTRNRPGPARPRIWDTTLLRRPFVASSTSCSASEVGKPRYAEIFGTLKIRPNDLDADDERRSLQKAIIYLPLGDSTIQSATRVQLPLSATVRDFRGAVGTASQGQLRDDDVSVTSLQGVKFADMTRLSQIVFNEFNVKVGRLVVSVTAVDADAYDAKSLIGDDEAPSAFGIDSTKG